MNQYIDTRESIYEYMIRIWGEWLISINEINENEAKTDRFQCDALHGTNRTSYEGDFAGFSSQINVNGLVRGTFRGILTSNQR